MAEKPGLDVDALHGGLRRAARKGATASRLMQYAPEVVELLCSAAAHPDLRIEDRAIRAEALIRQGVESIGDVVGDALAILLCFRPWALTRFLSHRRRAAAELLGMEAETFRRDRYEGALFYDLTECYWKLALKKNNPIVA